MISRLSSASSFRPFVGVRHLCCRFFTCVGAVVSCKHRSRWIKYKAMLWHLGWWLSSREVHSNFEGIDSAEVVQDACSLLGGWSHVTCLEVHQCARYRTHRPPFPLGHQFSPRRWCFIQRRVFAKKKETQRRLIALEGLDTFPGGVQTSTPCTVCTVGLVSIVTLIPSPCLGLVRTFCSRYYGGHVP